MLALAALEHGRIASHAELDRAMADTIAGTTGDTLLEGRSLSDWMDRRERLNRFFRALDWPEFTGCNITQKLMDDVRYGREAQFAGRDGRNLNALTPLAAARLIWDLFDGRSPLSRPARARAQMTLWRDRHGPDAALAEYQVSGYLGSDLPEDVEIWSKAGHNLWTGDPRAIWYKHDMIRMSGPGRPPLIVVLMTQGQAIAEGHPDNFPQVGQLIWDMTADLGFGTAQVRKAHVG